MKKTVFAAIIAAAAAFAAAESRQIEWNHANDSGPIAGLTQVQYATSAHSAKNDDRIQYTVAPTGIRQDQSIRHNDTHERLAREGSR